MEGGKRRKERWIWRTLTQVLGNSGIDKKHRQSISELLHERRLLIKKSLSCADVIYFYSSKLWYNLSLHLASGNGPAIFQVC